MSENTEETQKKAQYLISLPCTVALTGGCQGANGYWLMVPCVKVRELSGFEKSIKRA